MIFPLISCLFLIVAIVCFLHLTPKQIAEDILELTVKEPTLRDQVRALRTGKQKKSIGIAEGSATYISACVGAVDLVKEVG